MVYLALWILERQPKSHMGGGNNNFWGVFCIALNFIFQVKSACVGIKRVCR